MTGRQTFYEMLVGLFRDEGYAGSAEKRAGDLHVGPKGEASGKKRRIGVLVVILEIQSKAVERDEQKY